MKKVRFFTLGCKVNLYETEAMKGIFEKRGYEVTDSDDADVFVINTCTVTSIGDRKSRQMIRRAKRKNPNSIVAVVGCYSQVAADEVRKIPEVDIVLGTTGRAYLADYVEAFSGTRIDKVADKIPAIYEDMPSVNQSRTRATLKIQDGCTNFCSYCIIPFARGPVRSRTVESAVDEVKKLVSEGFSEFVLVGIHLGSYGRDLGLSLIDIINPICAIDGVKRVRLGSLEPNLLTDEFISEIMKLDNLCHNFHISMQSGCSATLKRMNRRYDKDKYLDCVMRIKKAMPDCAVTTDVICGFPGETDEEFKESMDTVSKCGFADLHVFPYSRREGTAAAVMENQVDENIKAKRTAKMIELGKKMREEYCKNMIGKVYEVLFEKEIKDGIFEGLTKNYIRVFAQGHDMENSYKNVKITAFCGEYCEGELV